jgi:D-alanyl-D-alanine carboxypeptidase
MPKLQIIPDSINTIDYLTGKFKPEDHPAFVVINRKYANQEGRILRKEAYEAFLKMHDAAKADSINLQIISATRNFDYQKGIWERKWNGQRQVEGQDLSQTMPNAKERALKILEYSSMPGTSRHHWGTDIDINDFENSYFESGRGLKEYEWLKANAGRYGFCQVYTEKGTERPDGYEMEKWHWSYLPLAKPLTEMAKEQLKNENISGFKGAEAATKIDVVQKYVLGIHPSCQ